MKSLRLFTWRRAALAGLVVLLLVLGLGFHWARPLLPSGDYVVEATFKRRLVQAKLFKPLFISDLYYVHLTENADPRATSAELLPMIYQWVGFNPAKEKIFVPIAMYTRPWGFHYIHTDQQGGIRLADSKLGDNWVTKFSPTNAWCSNGALSISFFPAQRTGKETRE